MTCHVKGISCVWGISVFQRIVLVSHLLHQACSKTKKALCQNTPTVYNYPRRDFRTYPNYFPVMKRM